MKITEITVTYGLTHNLGNYSNVRPDLRLTAVLDEGEDAEGAIEQLYQRARAFCEEAADLALEQDGQRAHFSTEPRYRVQRTAEINTYDRGKITPPELLLIITPGTVELTGRTVTYVANIERKIRLSHARRAAAEYAAEHPGYRVVEALDDQAVAALPAWLFREPEPAPAEPVMVVEADDDDGPC